MTSAVLYIHAFSISFKVQGACSSPGCTPGGIVPETVCPSQQAGAAAALLLSPCEALANEFDVLNEPKPSSNYIIDDANVLNKTTRKAVNDQLSRLEVSATVPAFSSLAGVQWGLSAFG